VSVLNIDARQLGAVLLSQGSRHFKSVLSIGTRIEVDDDVFIGVRQFPLPGFTGLFALRIPSMRGDDCIDPNQFREAAERRTPVTKGTNKEDYKEEPRAGPDRLNRIPRRLSGLLPGLALCNFARGA
jgi:hypothetical protein